jgi:hypothetical protein
MCSNLRNKSHCFYNEQLTKEEYKKKIQALNLGSYASIEKIKKDYQELKNKAIHKYATIVNSHDATGDNIDHAEHCKNCFDINGGVKDSSYVFWGAKGVNDCYYCGPGIGWGDVLYESFDGGAGGGRFVATSVVYYSTEVQYSFNCYNCNDLFGCIGLRNKSFCILNKQYSKEEYQELLPKIKKHMDDMPYVDKKGRTYRYGEFFPVELSPFCYNETIANDFYPLSKDEIHASGFAYKAPEAKKFAPTISWEELTDSITDVTDDILSQIIECKNEYGNDRCSTAFRIIPAELSFYRVNGIPFPRHCYQCRHQARFKKRTPLYLWHRTCMCDKNHPHHSDKCTVEFETSYAPDRPEIIYCEKCYQAEVY